LSDRVEVQNHSLPSPANLIEPRFHPGGIHDKLDFWAQDLQAGKWVLDLIAHGYVVPFKAQPASSELENKIKNQT